MRGLASSLLTAMSYFEIWGEDYMDPDMAVKALEEIASELAQCTDEEIRALADVAREQAQRARAAGATPEWVRFYENFIDNAGLASRL